MSRGISEGIGDGTSKTRHCAAKAMTFDVTRETPPTDWADADVHVVVQCSQCKLFGTSRGAMLAVHWEPLCCVTGARPGTLAKKIIRWFVQYSARQTFLKIEYYGRAAFAVGVPIPFVHHPAVRHGLLRPAGAVSS